MRKSKKKRSKVEIAKENAWKVFSKYIRLRDGGRCITCGARPWNLDLGEPDWKQLQAGHYRHNKFDFDEMNINCQCVHCNHFLSGNLGAYALYLKNKYGVEAWEELQNRPDKPDKRTKEEWDMLALEYRDRIKNEDWK